MQTWRKRFMIQKKFNQFTTILKYTNTEKKLYYFQSKHFQDEQSERDATKDKQRFYGL